MLHYFYLVSFGWMLCEGLHLYTMVVKVFNLSSKIYHYTVIAWGKYDMHVTACVNVKG